ncbi:DUF805 domain-containing protein [Pseudomonas sp. BW7P1]|uniref:DUF805 domain-containing protein n=1 Tax=Pseudomonas TaxID=286 RepID=UPI0021ADB0F7|nr:DUF805 domain-containing protein [Pseudomonas sp. BW7P1]UWI63495.1 DUF805 domain-containing protein [Pseudomonas sp. BW7P1]
MKWYLQVLRKYATFKGRASRKEFWMFFLIETCLQAVYLAIGYATELNREPYYLLALPIYGVLTLSPRLAVIWRRYHDMNKSGLNIFWAAVPLVGPFILLITLAASGTKGENSHGPDPREPKVVHA